MSDVLVVYGDFTCPYSYLASSRVDALLAAGVRAEFRAVEHTPDLSVGDIPLDAKARAGIGKELAEIEALLLPGEAYAARIPSTVCRTDAMVSAYAEACEAGVGPQVRRLLFGAYWSDARGLGNPRALWPRLAPVFRRGHSRSLTVQGGYGVSLDGGPITSGAFRRVRDWHEGWDGLGSRTIPGLDGPDRILTGVPALRRLGDEITARGLAASVPADAAAAARPVRPPLTWVSWVGGGWLVPHSGLMPSGGSPAP